MYDFDVKMNIQLISKYISNENITVPVSEYAKRQFSIEPAVTKILHEFFIARQTVRIASVGAIFVRFF